MQCREKYKLHQGESNGCLFFLLVVIFLKISSGVADRLSQVPSDVRESLTRNSHFYIGQISGFEKMKVELCL